MTDTLSEALHARLDRMGAAPRETSQADAMPRQDETPAAPPNEPELALVQGGQPDQHSALEETPQGEETDGEAEAGLEQEQQKGETPERYKAAEFAQAIGWEPQDLYETLEVPIGDAGETLTLGEIKDQYGELAAARVEVTQAQAALRAQQEQYQAALQQQLQGGQALTEEIQEAAGKVAAIEQQYRAQNWDALEKENPGQAANLRQKFATAYAGAQNDLKQAQEKSEVQRQEAMSQYMAQQATRIAELIPEWKDAETYKAENPEIGNYLLTKGFTVDEMRTMTHAGLQAIARDAWLWSKHKTEVAKAKGKMTRKPPKPVLRPGGPAVASATARMAQDLEQRARETGTSQDKLAAAKAIVQSSFAKR